MEILRKLFVVALCLSSLLTGCCLRLSRDQPLPVAKTLPPTQTAEVTVALEVAPPAPSAPLTTPVSKKPLSPLVGQNSKPRTNYTVSDGELLWGIAKRPDVYGDPSLWPLLYQANRDQIKDPRKIYTGQILIVPRNVSEEAQEKARIFAKKFDFISPE